jgi:hypothetical protein
VLSVPISPHACPLFGRGGWYVADNWARRRFLGDSGTESVVAGPGQLHLASYHHTKMAFVGAVGVIADYICCLSECDTIVT